ncbi:hypothetical protein [Myxosarcina sp. GI1]|uniref:hypothetical protein n=1 Tax=Myxosarcina sp. GI1 TaxID=1541065 RepID=UPI0005685E6F|nr:hypothetical protein [Myxosarcina sp. GI1]
MENLVLDKNTWIWFWFTVYALTTVFILPNKLKFDFSKVSDFESNIFQFAWRFGFRNALAVFVALIIKNII